MANNPPVGAWELVSESDTGIIIYTGSHYAASLMPKDRQRSTRHETTPDEALDAMFTCPALADTYTVSGSRITHVRVANVRPELSGPPHVIDYTIDGETMTQTVVSGGRTAGASFKFRKTPSGGVESPLPGAWEMVDDAEQGPTIFTKTHYVIVRMHKQRDLPKGEQYTPEGALTTLYTSGAQAGPYTISGTTLSMERTSNLRPQATGVTGVMDITIDGDTLKTQTTSGFKITYEYIWHKV